MKVALLGLVIMLATLGAQQFPPLPPAPAPQRGQASPATPAPTPLTAAQCKCSIEVTVKRPGGEPISDVDITVTAAPQARVETDANGVNRVVSIPAASSDTLIATTDASGHAILRDLAQATYSVRAQRDGYMGIQPNGIVAVLNQVGATVNVGPAPATGNTAPDTTLLSAVSLGAALSGLSAINTASIVPKPNQQVQLTMIQGATISGRLQDSNRRPVSGVQVGAFHVEYRDGQRMLAQTGTMVQTDDRGEYRLFWFPPGEYYIRTGTQAAALIRNQGYPVQTFYPGTLDPTRAIPIVLREGQEFSGAGFDIQPTNGVTVSGTIVNNIPGGRVQPNGQVNRFVSSVFLVPRNPVFGENPQLLPNINVSGRGSNPDGTNTPFEIRGVPPGTYDFYPIFNDPGPAAAAGRGVATRLNYYTGRTPIEVGSENVTGITAAILPGADLKGHVTIVGTPPSSTRPQPVTMTNIRIQLRSIDNLPSLASLNTSVTLDSDGTFTLANVVDARYIIPALNGIPADAYVADMHMGSQSLYDNGVISVGKGTSEPLEIVVSRGGGTVQGTLQDAQHNPVAATRVVLIPDAPHQQNLMLYKTSQSGAMGNFTMSGVAPGAYKLFAWESIPNGAEQNVEFMREYEQRGTSVIVGPGVAAAKVTVTVIPNKH